MSVSPAALARAKEIHAKELNGLAKDIQGHWDAVKMEDTRNLLNKNYKVAEKWRLDRKFKRNDAKHQRFALCIGCNYKDSCTPLGPLNGCINDADHMAELLERNYGFRLDDITIMTDEPLTRYGWHAPPKIQATLPTKENVMKVLEKFVSKMSRGDCLVFYFSGHGSGDKGKNPGDAKTDTTRTNEKDGQDEYLCLPGKTEESSRLMDDVLHDRIVKKLPEGCKFTAIFDACQSGGALDLNYELKLTQDQRGWELGKWKSVMNTNADVRADVTLISGCDSSQYSRDGRVGGSFTTGLVEILSKTPYNHSFEELLTKTLLAVWKGTDQRSVPSDERQNPTLSSSIPFDVEKKYFSFDECGGIDLPPKEDLRTQTARSSSRKQQPSIQARR